MKRTNYIDALRAFALFLVMLGHAIPKVGPYFTYTSPIKIPLFFAISGFLYRSRENETWASFAKRKIRGLLIPYLLLGLISSLLTIAVKVLYLHTGTLPELLKSSAIGLLTGDTLWFLPCLMIHEVWLEILGRMKNHVLFAITASILFASSVILFLTDTDLPWHITAAGLMLVPSLYARGMHRFLDKLRLPHGIAILAAYIGLTAVLQHYGLAGMNVGGNRYNCLPLNLIDMLIGITGLFAIFRHIRFPRPVLYVGRNTLPYYALHMNVVSTVSLVLTKLHLPDPDTNLLCGIIVVLLTCVICAIPTELLQKFLPCSLGGRK